MNERIIHTAIFDYLNSVLPESHLVAHTMNNARSARAGAEAKRMGMMAGYPDLTIVRPLGRVAYIEVKAEKGRLSPAQIAFRLHCIKWGIPHAVCRSIDEARDFIEAIGIETREA